MNQYYIVLIFAIIVACILFLRHLTFVERMRQQEIEHKYRYRIERKDRQDYYRKYLKSGEWQRKRYVVLKRDNWRCVYCGARATQVHHLKYARNIGKEPIEWLVSICKSCHDAEH